MLLAGVHAPRAHRQIGLGAAEVHETQDDLAELQDLLDRSYRDSGEHLRSAFDQANRLSARAFVASLTGIFEMHLAVVTSDGAPLVAPVDGFVLRGKLCFGLPEDSIRARLVRRDPRVSASFATDTVAFIAHGTTVEVAPGDPWAELYDATARQLYVAQYGDWFKEWLDQREAVGARGFTGFIEPRVMFVK